MSHIALRLDDGSGLAFQSAIADALPADEILSITTIDDGTKEGEPAVAVSFPVHMPNGKTYNAVKVVTVRNFLDAASGIAGKYPKQLERRWPTKEVGHTIKGEHRGMKFEALLMEKFYIVSIKGLKGQIAIAGSETDVPAVANGMIDTWFASR